MSWTTQDGIRMWYAEDHVKIDPITGDIHLAIFDIHDGIFYSASDSEKSGIKGPLDYVFSYPDVESIIESMTDWTIVFVADKLDDSAIQPWMKWIMLSGSRKNNRKVRGEKLYYLLQKKLKESLDSDRRVSAASFYCSPTESVIPLDLIDVYGITHYLPSEMFSKWPGLPLNQPSIRDSGKDLILFVGSSGSGRDEASAYLKSKGYIEVRRTGDYQKRIERELRSGRRVFFNATNPKLIDRSPFVEMFPEVRIWWFVRPGRNYSKSIPEIAYTKYSKSFEIPTRDRDKMPVIRLT